MKARVSRVAVVAAAASAAGCGLLFDFGDFDDSRPSPSSDGGGDDGALAPARSFVLEVEPASLAATTGDRSSVTVRVKRGELFTEEVALAVAPGQDVVLEAPVVAKGASDTRADVIPGGSHGVKTVTIVGTAPSGVTASTSLRVDVRGRPGTLDTAFAAGGVLEDPGLAYGVDVVTVDGDRIVVATKETASGLAQDAITLARFTEGGALDVTFGTGGRVQVVAPGGGTGGTQCVARGPSPGSILVGGTNGTRSFLHVGLVDDKGKTITTFGPDGSGTVSAGQADCKSLAALAGGSIVLAATTFLQRRLANGAADSTFGDAGEIPFTQPGEALTGALAEDGGAIRAFGTFKSWPISASGARGVEAQHAPALGCSVAVRPRAVGDGRSVVGGTCGGVFGGSEPKPTIGVLADGAPVEKFGDLGFVQGPGLGFGAVVLGRPGGLVRVGGTNKPSRLGVTMYDDAGALRWSFDGASTAALAGFQPLGATFDARGRIVIVGLRERDDGPRLLLLRLWS